MYLAYCIHNYIQYIAFHIKYKNLQVILDRGYTGKYYESSRVYMHIQRLYESLLYSVDVLYAHIHTNIYIPSKTLSMTFTYHKPLHH